MVRPVRKRILKPALVALALFLGAPAHAQRPHGVRDELPAEAQHAWDDAKRFYDARQFDGASVEYEKAYELSKNPRVLYNVGVCQKELSHYARAIMTFRRALRDGAGTLSPDETKAINGAITVLESYTTTLSVRTDEPGASVFVDELFVGKTPLDEPVPIDPGEARVVRVQKDGFVEVRQTLRVDPSSKPVLDLRLVPVHEEHKTHVSVRVVGPPAATISVDGKEVGQGSFEGDLPADQAATPYTFAASAPGYVELKQSVVLVYGKPLKLTLAMIPERHEGLLHLTVSPRDASIEVDRQPVDVTSWDGKLAAGAGHHLVVKRPGYVTRETEVVLADDQKRDIEVSLDREKSDTLWWVTGAAVVVAGGAVLSYFLFRTADQAPVEGTLRSAPVMTSVRLP